MENDDLQKDAKIHRRRSVRLKRYDYGQNGAYFITICTYNRKCLFGKIANRRGEKSFAHFIPTETGKIVKKCWLEIPAHYPNVILDEYVIMPNHLHGILFIDNEIVGANMGAKDFSPLPQQSRRPIGTSKTIGAIVRGFKIGATKWARTHTDICTVWQRNYYEHIIRDENSLEKIREYVVNNKHNWNIDKLFSDSDIDSFPKNFNALQNLCLKNSMK